MLDKVSAAASFGEVVVCGFVYVMLYYLQTVCVVVAKKKRDQPV